MCNAGLARSFTAQTVSELRFGNLRAAAFMALSVKGSAKRKDRQCTGRGSHRSHHARGAKSRESWDSIFHTIARTAQTPAAKQHARQIAANIPGSDHALHWCLVRGDARLLCATLLAASKTNPQRDRLWAGSHGEHIRPREETPEFVGGRRDSPFRMRRGPCQRPEIRT